MSDPLASADDDSECVNSSSACAASLWADELCSWLGSYSTISEPGLADRDTTREEAELLMGMCAGKSRSVVPPRASPFSFTCPSLSLETDNRIAAVAARPGSRRVSNEREPLADRRRAPADLLGRTLRIDDRDALRLSADAMGRNLLHSFQEALRWRVRQWQQQIARELVLQEAQVPFREIVQSPLATLYAALQAVEIRVVSAGTAFRVVPADQPPRKRRRRSSDASGASVTTTTIAHADKDTDNDVRSLILDCHVVLDTPGGSATVDLEVPGTLTRRKGTDNLAVDVDTAMVAAMIERSGRKIVRASVEHRLKNPPTPTTTSTETPRSSVASPLATSAEPRKTSDWNSAVVTPKANSATSDSDAEVSANPNMVSPCLVPLPDSLLAPRRISPQPPHTNAGSEQQQQHPMATLQPRRTSATTEAAKSMWVTPPTDTSDKDYRDATSQSPSLPLLVEVACRAMKTTTTTN